MSGSDDTVPAPAGSTVASGIAEGDTARADDLLDGPIELPSVESSTYELREQLGAGGMGKVVVARDRRLGRLLAIKVAQTSDRSLRVRFAREAVLTARLQHPSIIPVHEAGVWTGDEPFYAMKLVAGASLAKLIANSKTLDERLALIPNVIAVVDALAYAHAQRVIHRDLKPDNVIVGEYGETIVIDWGLAKELDVDDEPEPTEASPYRFDAGQTVAGAAMGTPPYMAPEQAAGERVDERADVYGLGAMLYHVLSGVAPYKGANADEVMEQVLKGPPLALAARQDGIPKDLLAIVDKAMARDPLDRYANAGQLAADLKRFERGQLVAAHAYSRGELLRRWLVKHRALVGVTLAAVVLISVAITFWVRAELRDREARGLRVAELVHADDTDEATARAQLGAGKFTAAADTLARQVEHLKGKDEAGLEGRRRERAAELDRVQRIAQFYEHAHLATFLYGDEDRGEDAIYELTFSLRQVGAIDAAGTVVTQPWWEHLFVDELTPAQQHEMQLQAYRLVLDLAVMHFKAGALLVKMQLVFMVKSPESAMHFRRTLELLPLTTALEHVLGIKPARVTRIWQQMSLFFLNGVGTEQDIAAAGAGSLPPPAAADATRADNADDYALLGAGQFLVWKNQDNTVGKALQMTFPDLFDYAHPLDTAEQQLRTAIRLDPRQYWPNFMLGLTLRSRGDLAGAELAFDICVMLEPTFMLGYGARALPLAELAKQQKDPARHDELLARALADSDATVKQEPDRAVTYWTRGELMGVLERREDAVAAFTRALELEDNVLGKFSGQEVIRELTPRVIGEMKPGDVGALTLLAFMALATKDHDHAIDWASQALHLQPDHARALAIRGTAYLETGKLDLALTDLSAAVTKAPDNSLAALGYARVLEAAGTAPGVLAAYDALLRVAVVREHRLQAQLGRYRILKAWKRTAEADAALAAAKAIDPARAL